LLFGEELPGNLMTSHAHIASQLPTIVRETMRSMRKNPTAAKQRGLVKRLQLISREIELLQPAVDDGGRRPDNCEYPWLDQSLIQSPLDHSFPIVDLLRDQPFGPTIAKLIQMTMMRMKSRLSAQTKWY
jgi:hypothetical protein